MRFLTYLTVSSVILGAMPPSLTAGNTRVLIWDEEQPEQKQGYVQFIGKVIGSYLSQQPGFSVKNVRLDGPDQGLDNASLDDTDVVIWWGHRRHGEVASERVEEIVRRVKAGRIGFIALHSSHFAQPFLRLMEERAKQDASRTFTDKQGQELNFEFLESPEKGAPFLPSVVWKDGGIRLMRPSGRIARWRAEAEPSQVRTLLVDHPIAKGLPKHWGIPQTEMYNEPFHVPEPDAVVLEEIWEKGERFRSLMTWSVGRGNVVYFRPGHETYPIFKQAENLKVIENAVAWLIDNR